MERDVPETKMTTRMTEGARGERCYRPRFSRLAPLSLARECTLLTKYKEKEGLSVIDNVHSGFFSLLFQSSTSLSSEDGDAPPVPQKTNEAFLAPGGKLLNALAVLPVKRIT